jgi:hypothetical protein
MSHENILDGCIAHALHIVMPQPAHEAVDRQADHEHADHMLRVVVPFDALLEEILGSVDRPDVERRGDPDDQAQCGIQDERQRIGEVEIRCLESRNDKGGMVPEEHLAEIGADNRGEGNRDECPDTDLVEHDFDGKQNPSHRSVEGRGNSGTGTGRDQGDPLPYGHRNDLPHGGTERRTDLNDRPFTT